MTIEEFTSQWTDGRDFIEAHTSGSTGAPKPVRLLKSDMEISAKATCSRFGIDSSSTLVIPLSMDYIAGKMMAVRSFVSGARLVTLPPSRHPLEKYQGGHIDLLAIVPSQIDGLLSAIDHISVGNVIIGGAPMTHAQEQRLAEAGVNAFATYGMTETCSHVALRPVTQPCYEAMPRMRFSTTADDCLIIDTGKMSVGRISTRDVVELHSPTSFRWLGRADNCINSGGVKLFPELIEERLATVMSGRQFYITSRRSEEWGSEAVMVILDDTAADDELKAAIEQALPPYWRPKCYLNDPEPQFTSSGKLIRKRF